MKRLLFLGAVALLSIPAAPALAVPMCGGPPIDHFDRHGQPQYDEEGSAYLAEMELRAHGIDANMTRWWNGCLQTFVHENGREVMKFYDPDTYEEIPAN